MDVIKAGATGICGIGSVHCPIGQPPDQKAVNGAKTQLTSGGAITCTFDAIQNPAQFCGGEIGVEQQAGLRGDRLFMSASFQNAADICGASVLPDDGVMDRFAGGAVPDDGRFTLIGDTDGKWCCALFCCCGNHGTRHVQRGIPYRLGIMFDPSVLRKDLREFSALLRQNGAVLVKQNGTR